MALTIGAILLFIGLIYLIYYGFSIGVGSSSEQGEQYREKCHLCLREFDRSKLIERQAPMKSGQAGDIKLFYFCEECVRTLFEELEKAKGNEGRQADNS